MPDSCGVGNIRLIDLAIAPGLASQSKRFLCCARKSGVCAGCMIDHNVSALARQSHRRSPPDAPRSTGYYGRLAVKTTSGSRIHDWVLGFMTVNKSHCIKTQHRVLWQFPMPTAVLLPKATITMTEANVITWRKRPGDFVTKDEILFEMETDKVVVEVPAPATGFLLRIDVAEGLAQLVQPIGWIGAPGDQLPAMSAAPSTPGAMDSRPMQSAATTAGSRRTAPSSPAARRRARELGVELASVRGSGPGGRITEADVEDAAHRQ